MDTLDPKNLTALLDYRGRGNPPSAHPSSAISNCFPGLEYDFRAVWKQVFEDLEIHESSNEVLTVSDPNLAQDIEPGVLLIGAVIPSQGAVAARELGFRTPVLGPGVTPDRMTNLEWTNSLAELIRDHQGSTVRGVFVPRGGGLAEQFEVEIKVRRFMDGVWLPESLGAPGALTQGLCSPWQADFRECGCYYWAASRPDFVNVDEASAPVRGHNWLVKQKTDANRTYDSGATEVSYEELYRNWQGELGFIVGGQEQS